MGDSDGLTQKEIWQLFLAGFFFGMVTVTAMYFLDLILEYLVQQRLMMP